MQGADITFARITVTGTENILMAAALARGRTVLRSAACEPEIINLADLLVAMGAQISGAGTDTIEIEGVAELHGARHTVIPDRIEAGTYVIAALLAGSGVRVTGCRPDHLTALLDTLRGSGAALTTGVAEVSVPPQPAPLRALTLATAEYPGFATDLQGQLLPLLTQAQGRSEVSETIFENRFQHALELMRMGARIEVAGCTAFVDGPTPLEGTTVMASDLRASATLVLAGLIAQGETIVDRIYHLDRGYEAMEAKLTALGARIERFNPGPYV